MQKEVYCICSQVNKREEVSLMGKDIENNITGKINPAKLFAGWKNGVPGENAYWRRL